jgi:signal transduction histidine kinase
VDAELARAAALFARSMEADAAEGLPLAEAAHDALEDLELAGRALAVFGDDGARIAGRFEGLERRARAPLRAEPELATVTSGGGLRRVRLSRHAYAETHYRLGVAESLGTLDAELAGLRRALVGGLLSALALAALGGLWIARAALGPVRRMAAEARRITEHTPGFRLGLPPARDELRVLGDAINELLGRLERALSQQRQFMADASHELRTPVSVARTATDVALSASSRPESD